MAVVIHQDDDGIISVYGDPGDVVLWVDERVPDDRIFRMPQVNIPAGMLDGSIGHIDDGSRAGTRVKFAEAAALGKPFLTVVPAPASEADP